MISIRLSLVGAHVDCRMKTSRPRTFSSSSTITSPSEKRPTTQRPRLMLRCWHTASRELRVRVAGEDAHALEGHGRESSAWPAAATAALATDLPANMAGEEGFEPSNAGIKIRCLNHLATPQRENRRARIARARMYHVEFDPAITRTPRADVARACGRRNRACRAAAPRRRRAPLAPMRTPRTRTPRSRHPRMPRMPAQFGQGRADRPGKRATATGCRSFRP